MADVTNIQTELAPKYATDFLQGVKQRRIRHRQTHRESGDKLTH